MRKEILPVFLAAALVGSACQRPPETNPPPQRTPLAASGEPRPQPDFQAAVQAAVKATMTAQQPTKSSETTSGLAWKQFRSEDFPYEISYPPDWKPIKKNGREMIVGETVNELQTDVQVIASPKRDFTLTDVLRSYIKVLKQKETEFQQEKTRLADFDAWIIITKGGNNKSSTRAQAFSIIGDQLWSLSLYTDSSVAKKEMPKFKKMIGSFTLTQPPLRAETPPKPAVVPAARRTETPKQEGSKTIEEQVKEHALDYMYNLLSSTIQHEYGFKQQATLASRITNASPTFPKKELVQGKPVSQDSDLLQISWVHTAPTNNGYQKTIGEAEIKNIKLLVTNVAMLTDADRANGILWSGEIQIEFIGRHRIAKPWLKWTTTGPFGGDRLIPDGSEDTWRKTILPKPSMLFTPWKQKSFNVPIMQKGGNTFPQKTAIYPIEPFFVDYNDCSPFKGLSMPPECQVIPIPLPLPR